MKMDQIRHPDMITRETIDLETSQLLTYEDAPEKVCLLLPKSILKNSFDIGIIAYSVRGMKYKPQKNIQAVCIDSLQKERQYFLTLLYDHIVTQKWEDTSILTFLKYIRTILNWTDSNNNTDLFKTPGSFRLAYIAFTNHLNDQIYHRKIQPITASPRQRAMKDMATIHFGAEEGKHITSGIITITFEIQDEDAPEKSLVQHNTEVFLAIAKGYGSAVLEMQPYPWLLKMPNYHTYVFPSNLSIKTPFTTAYADMYNYKEGRLSTTDELSNINHRTKFKNAQDIKRSQECIEKHNSLGLNSCYRIADAAMALNAYMQVFMLMTGSYGTEARQIIYNNTLNIERHITNNSFRAVKFRAGGKTVEYSLGSQHGLRILKDYLTFREYILQGKEFKYLFFRINNNGEYVQYTEANIAGLVTRARKFFFYKKASILRSRKVRKFKSVHYHEEKHGTKITAKALNHDEKTNQKSYTPSSPDTSKKELGTLWSAIKKAAKEIKITEDKIGNDISISTGHCSNKGNPEKIQEYTPIEPDCKKQFGCLFCSKYIIHADRDDIHKILSVRYVIEQVLKMSTDTQRTEKLLRVLCVRIDYLIERLQNYSVKTKMLIDKLYVDVFEYGDLTTFWSFRLERYAEMGMIL